MSVFLTPDLKPFGGGTYYPPTDAYGRPGFKTMLLHMSNLVSSLQIYNIKYPYTNNYFYYNYFFV